MLLLAVSLIGSQAAPALDSGAPKSMQPWPTTVARAPFEGEVHLRNIRQLTFGGQNAECYWDTSGERLIWQSTQPEYPDEQIFTMRADGTMRRLVSTGLGRCTCGYFLPDGKGIVFSSTHERDPGPQEKPDMSHGYVWKINPNFSIYRANVDGSGLRPLIRRQGYVAETTVSPDGKYLVFTGTFDGDLEIYRANLDGSGIKRLTHEFGYDGGPFVSWDGKHIVYRRGIYDSDQAKEEYSNLLAKNLVKPGKLEIWIMDSDGRNKHQVTRLGCASFAPFLHPDNRRIIFSSNYGDPKGREFDLYMIDVDGTGLTRITHTPEFDGFPMFDRTGKKLVWSSNRHGTARGETNIFVADWVELAGGR